MDERESTNRELARYVAQLRRDLADGKLEIERQQASVDETRAYLRREGDWLSEQGGP